jgi:hypothetical protein
MSRNDVELRYILNEEVTNPDNATGGIQLLIDGSRINRFYNEPSIDFVFDWYPEYIGKIHPINFSSLVDSAYKIAAGEVDIYESVTTDFDPAMGYFLLEPLSKEEIRVAFRVCSSLNKHIVEIKSACGYVVDRCLFCQAVSDVSHEYISDIKSGESLRHKGTIEEFEVSLTELDKAIEDCEQTPPEMN